MSPRTIDLWRRHREHVRSIAEQVNNKHYRDVQDHVNATMFPMTIVNTDTAHQELVALVETTSITVTSRTIWTP